MSDDDLIAVLRKPSTPITSKQRRDFTSRQLFEMADNAREGIPPAGSVASSQIRDAEQRGDFAKAIVLREEVKEREKDLRRMARAQQRAEKRAANRRPKRWGEL